MLMPCFYCSILAEFISSSAISLNHCEQIREVKLATFETNKLSVVVVLAHWPNPGHLISRPHISSCATVESMARSRATLKLDQASCVAFGDTTTDVGHASLGPA